jgi:hypothetical protein
MGFDSAKSKFVAIGIGSQMRGAQPICGQLWVQEERIMTETCTPPPEYGQSKEVIALAGVLDALQWRHVLETNTSEKAGLSLVIDPRLLSKLVLVVPTTDAGMDGQSELWPLCEVILNEQDTWHLSVSDSPTKYSLSKERYKRPLSKACHCPGRPEF